MTWSMISKWRRKECKRSTKGNEWVLVSWWSQAKARRKDGQELVQREGEAVWEHYCQGKGKGVSEVNGGLERKRARLDPSGHVVFKQVVMG